MGIVIFIFWILCAIPVILPLLIGCLASRSPWSVRVALILAGIASAIHTCLKLAAPSGGGGSIGNLSPIMLPLSNTIISFSVAISCTLASIPIHSIAKGNPFARDSIYAGLVLTLWIAFLFMIWNNIEFLF